MGWKLSRIEEATGSRREAISGYLKATGIAVRRPWLSERIETKTASFRRSVHRPGRGKTGHQGGGVHRLDSGPTAGSCAERERVRAVSCADRRGTPYIAMEQVKGTSLGMMLCGGPLPVREVLHIGRQIADGLAKARAAGIVHPDLKPENVMITEDGHVKIVDFGLAKLGPSGHAPLLNRSSTELPTASGIVMGTVGYMSPEQAAGDLVDHRCDQFALGLILYEMATGIRAFRRASRANTRRYHRGGGEASHRT